jgi:hypothetical protein
MQVISARCAGIDVHQRTVVVCVWVTAPDGSVQRAVPTLGTLTADLLALSDWLEARAVRQVAMESTGGFWKPVDNRLEAGRTILLVNPPHRRAVPGRTTDVRESAWLADPARVMACSPPAASRPSRHATCAS